MYGGMAVHFVEQYCDVCWVELGPSGDDNEVEAKWIRVPASHAGVSWRWWKQLSCKPYTCGADHACTAGFPRTVATFQDWSRILSVTASIASDVHAESFWMHPCQIVLFGHPLTPQIKTQNPGKTAPSILRSQLRLPHSSAHLSR